MSTFGPDDLDEWVDLFTDNLIIDQQQNVDVWGNPLTTTSDPIPCKVMTRSKMGGQDKGYGEQQEQDDVWRVTFVFFQTTPTPSINEHIKINGTTYKLVTLEVFDDDQGNCYVGEAISINEEAIP